jgi:hypothetical protein
MAAEGLDGSGESLRGRYDMSAEQMRVLSARILNERAADVPDKYRYVAMEIDGAEQYADIGRYVERTVFEQAFGNDTTEMEREYGSYENASTFFVSFDREKQSPSGALRVISESPAGFKTFNDIASEPFYIDQDHATHYHDINDLNKVWDIGTVAVLPEYRSGQGAVSVQLYRAVYLAALHHDIEHFVSIIDEIPLTKMRDYLAIPFEPLADSHPGPYLGSGKSHAVYGYVPEFFEKANRKRYTLKGLLARKALNRLIKGTEDDAILLDGIE